MGGWAGRPETSHFPSDFLTRLVEYALTWMQTFHHLFHVDFFQLSQNAKRSWD